MKSLKLPFCMKFDNVRVLKYDLNIAKENLGVNSICSKATEQKFDEVR